MSTTAQMLDERYGRRRAASRRWLWLFVGVGAVAATALAWSTVANSINAVEADATGYAIVDAHSVVLEFQVSAPAGSTVACALEAQDEQHGVVGWKVVEFPASESHSQAYRETIPTIAGATTGLVNSCWVT